MENVNIYERQWFLMQCVLLEIDFSITYNLDLIISYKACENCCVV